MTLIGSIIKDDQLFEYITGQLPLNNKTTNIASTGYVDDVNHVCSNKDVIQLEKATSDMNTLASEIFRENRLKVNQEKTQILQVEANSSDATRNTRHMVTIQHKTGTKIKAKSQMKVLGVMLNARASMESHLSKMKSKVGMELSKLKPYLPMMSRECRKIIVNSKLKSILDYGAPLFLGEN